MNDAQHEKPKGAGKSSFELIDSDKLSDLLPIKKNTVILDLACGKGAYSMFLSKKLGEDGLIYAVDLWEEGLRLIQKEIESQSITNILTLQADATGQIDIDDFSVDLCLMATVLHDFDEAKTTEPVLKNIKNILKPNGCLAIIEFKKIDGPPGPPKDIRLSEIEAKQMVKRYGFRKGNCNEIGPYNYLMTFFSE